MTSLSPAEMTAIGGTAGVCEVMIMQVNNFTAEAELPSEHIAKHILSRLYTPLPIAPRQIRYWLKGCDCLL